jgi:large subunit ribosomal protein L35
MPKMKSKGAVKKRFRLTKSGKLKSNRPHRGHGHAPHNSKTRRNTNSPLITEGTWAVLLKRMMG